MKSISIIGLGLIGGSFAKAIKQFDSSIFISAFDKDEITSRVISENIINEKLFSIEDSIKNDIIFLSLPTGISIEVFSILIPLLKPNQLITDVCGVKSIFEEIWNKNKKEGIYIGGHPMTGKEKGGYENSDPLLFENAVYILTKNENNSSTFQYFINLLQNIGSRIKYLDAQTHDEIIALVSHLPQLISVALVQTASKQTNETNSLDFAAGGFRDMTRIASSDFSIWEPVLRQNKKEILNSLDNFSVLIQKMKTYISEEKIELLSELFETARHKRDEIPKNMKGFLHPLIDIFVYVKDEPGVLSKLTSHLFDNRINIKDIELLKIREGTGGTFRLSFENQNIADEAKLLLENVGFKLKSTN